MFVELNDSEKLEHLCFSTNVYRLLSQAKHEVMERQRTSKFPICMKLCMGRQKAADSKQTTLSKEFPPWGDVNKCLLPPYRDPATSHAAFQ